MKGKFFLGRKQKKREEKKRKGKETIKEESFNSYDIFSFMTSMNERDDDNDNEST